MVGAWRWVVAFSFSVGLLMGGTAHAATALHLLLNTDGDAASGCTVTTAKGSATGIDRILDTTLQIDADGNGTVGPIAYRTCSGGTFGAATTVDAGGWPVGHLDDAAHTAVVETYIPRGVVGDLSTLRLGLMAEGENGATSVSDALLPVAAPNLQPPTAIPTLSHPLAVLLTAVLIIVALWHLRRSHGMWRSLGVLVLVSGLVSLVWATVVRDGQITDWAGVAPFWTNSTDDPNASLSVRAIYGQADAQNLNFRIDVRLPTTTATNQAPQVNAGPNQTITLPAAATLAGTVTDDGLPNPPGAVTVTWSLVSGPGTVTFADPNSASTTATFSTAGTYVLRLTANDGALSASADVQVTALDPVVSMARIEFVSDQSLFFSAPGQSQSLKVQVIGTDGTVIPDAQVSWSSATPASVAVTPTGGLSAEVLAQTTWSGVTLITLEYPPLGLSVQAQAIMGTLAPQTVLASSAVVLAITGDRSNTHQVTLTRTAETERLQVGDILVTGDLAGVMVRILQVTIQTNQVVLQAEPVAINTAFRDLDLTVTGEPVIATLQATRQTASFMLRSGDGRRLLKALALPQSNLLSSDWQCEGQLSLAQLGVSALKVEEQLIPRIDLRIVDYQIVDFLLMLEGGASVDTRLAVSLSGEISGKCKLELDSVSLPAFPLSVFSIQPKITSTVGVELSGKAQGSATLTPQEFKGGWWLKGGVRYTSDRGWEAIADKRIDTPDISGSTDITTDGALEANFAPFGALAGSFDFRLGRGFLSTSLVEVKFLQFKVNIPYVKFSLPTPVDSVQFDYKGPDLEAGVAANAGFSLEVSLFKDILAKYLPLQVTAGFNVDLFSYQLVLVQTAKPTGSVTCTPDCNAVSSDGSSRVTFQSQADTAETGQVEFWASKNDNPQLVKLAEAPFSGGQGQAIFTAAIEAGTYKVYPRLKVDAVTRKLPLATEEGEPIGEFTVVGELSLSPTLVNLSGTGGESKTQSDALQVKNAGEAETDYVLQWNSQIQNVSLSPMLGTLQPQDSQSVSASFSCPIDGGNWQGQIGVRRPNGEIEGTASINLTCTCETQECKCPSGTPTCSLSNGDPHLYTFDRLAYDFQAVGEFIYAKSLLPDDTFEVQVRNRPWGNRTDVAVTQATAMNVAGDRVGFYVGFEPVVHINGEPRAIADGEEVTLPLGGRVTQRNNLYAVSWPDGSYVSVRNNGWGLLVKVSVPTTKYGQVRGLLGNADGDRQNDIAMRDGTYLGTQINFATLYPDYADSWRITQQESLFDYATGETTETFTDRNFPRTSASATDLSADARARAEQICREAGITDAVLLANCILDVALTGRTEFAQDQAGISPPQESVDVIAPPLPTINDPGFGQFAGSVVDAVTAQHVNSGTVDLTVDGTPIPRTSAQSIVDGAYETDVVPIGSGYRLDIQSDGYIAEAVFALSALDRQVRQVESVRLIPTTADGIGAVSGHARNALNNDNISGLNVLARRYVNQRLGDPVQSTVTDQNGSFTLQGLTAGNYTLELQGSGYITKYLTALSIGGQTQNLDEVISPDLGTAKIRIVLTWGTSPNDLDSHLTGPNSQGGRFHVYYGNRGNEDLTILPYAYLDRDDTNSFGPETITIGQLQSGGVYRYSVHDYSDRGSSSSQALAKSSAKVEVYNSNELVSTFTVPYQEGTLWTVFEIDETGHINPVNVMSYASNVNTISSARALAAPRSQSDAAGFTVTDYWHILFQVDKK